MCQGHTHPDRWPGMNITYPALPESIAALTYQAVPPILPPRNQANTSRKRALRPPILKREPPSASHHVNMVNIFRDAAAGIQSRLLPGVSSTPHPRRVAPFTTSMGVKRSDRATAHRFLDGMLSDSGYIQEDIRPQLVHHQVPRSNSHDIPCLDWHQASVQTYPVPKQSDSDCEDTHFEHRMPLILSFGDTPVHESSATVDAWFDNMLFDPPSPSANCNENISSGPIANIFPIRFLLEPPATPTKAHESRENLSLKDLGLAVGIDDEDIIEDKDKIVKLSPHVQQLRKGKGLKRRRQNSNHDEDKIFKPI